MRWLAAFTAGFALGCASSAASSVKPEHAKVAPAPPAAASAAASQPDSAPAASSAPASSGADASHAPSSEPASTPAASTPAPATASGATAFTPAAGAARGAGAAASSSDAASPAEVDGGVISRGALSVVLSAGIGRFLQRLHVERQLEKGRFVGWRVTEYAAGDATLRSSLIQPGDTVLRVNGQSIERPEQFKDVWDSMASSSALVIDVRRGARASQIRYRIVD